MVGYECYYSHGRQFIFTERRSRLIFGCLLLVALLGLCFGLCVGVAVSFGGVQTLQRSLLALGVFAALRAYYLCFIRLSSSVDLSTYVASCFVFTIVLNLLCGAVRYSLILDLDIWKRCLLYSVAGLILGLTIYGWILICCQEDERKHHLTLCCQEGDSSGGKLVNESVVAQEEGWEALTRFLAWLCRSQWYPFHDVPVVDEPVTSDEPIIVHNRTLKLIKVCFYASDDMFCWVPFGGVSGCSVGFIQAEQKLAFNLPRCAGHYGGFRLKVFQPGLLDKELACYTKAQRGQSFAFFDVECMVKRSRLLSSSPKKSVSSKSGSWSTDVPESSESEFEVSVSDSTKPVDEACSPLSASKADLSAGLGGMRRNRSAGDLQLRPRNDSASSAVALMSTRSETRRAAANEVVVRNRSNQEIRALLFKSTDYCYMVPLIGHVLACGDSIFPDGERRFNPPGCNEKELFTVKVYSVGPGAKELTYLTVERGQTYTFKDSCLSI
mmetsp:Transcript_87589/g.137213  ORF Transcript_87589/g.137213 Transcript_87589/m.137213 type:complete len:496 (-) Transcript_87589:41-1528(-)